MAASSAGAVPGAAGSHTAPSRSRRTVTTRPSGSTAAPLAVREHPSSAGAVRGTGVPDQHPPVRPAGDYPPVRQRRHRRSPALVAAQLAGQRPAGPPCRPPGYQAEAWLGLQADAGILG